jgi:NAD(P)-dependent dehydrogenase (short-subunit alcohol dehydrogenase family)
VEQLGGLHCAFNNAGINSPMMAFHEMSLEEWNRMIAVNLTAVFLCMKHELAHMVKSGGGAIVNTSSGAGLIAAPGMPHYTAAKHGVLGLVKTAAQEYARQNIRVNAICPGVTDTPMMRSFLAGKPEVEQMMMATLPFGRMGRPEEMAQAAVWLCSDSASFVSGESMLVDGASVCR